MLPKHLQLIVSATQLLIFFVWVAQALAGQVRLAWNATTIHTDDTPATDLAGYHLYYWQGSTGTPQSVDVGNTTTYTLTGLVDGSTYSFSVATYDISGKESSNSNIVTVTVLPDRAASLVAAYNFDAGSGTTVTDASGYHNTGTIR